jgi:hypothetical protein
MSGKQEIRMKKHIVLLGVMISGLVHAAAESSAPAKKMNCLALAGHIERQKELADYDVRRVKNGDLRTGKSFSNPEDLRDFFPCDDRSLDTEIPIRVIERAAALAQEGVSALEHCVQESPKYADDVLVQDALASLRQKADLLPQCLKLHRQVVQREADQVMAARKKQQEMDSYIRQHGKNKKGS